MGQLAPEACGLADRHVVDSPCPQGGDGEEADGAGAGDQRPLARRHRRGGDAVEGDGEGLGEGGGAQGQALGDPHQLGGGAGHEGGEGALEAADAG